MLFQAEERGNATSKPTIHACSTCAHFWEPADVTSAKREQGFLWRSSQRETDTILIFFGPALGSSVEKNKCNKSQKNTLHHSDHGYRHSRVLRDSVDTALAKFDDLSNG